MTAPPTSDTTFAWDQYWRDGRLASCGGEGGTNYQPVIAQGWRQFFDGLADGARMLDICTGNGAVARLAAETAVARNMRFAIDAVDAAAINPIHPGPGAEMIRFSPRIPAESLPFPDGCFDAIVGQYAIEYTDLSRTLVELRRVSRATAAVRFVTHAAGSVVVQGTANQLAEAERLLGTGIFEAAENLAEISGGGPAATSLDDARKKFRDSLQALRVAATKATDQVMYQNVGGVIVDAIQKLPLVGTTTVIDKIRETATAIKAHEGRLSAMRCAALDAPAVQALVESLESLWGRTFTAEALVREDDAVFGWVLG